MFANTMELNLNEMAAIAGAKDLPGGPIGMPTPIKEDYTDKIVKPTDVPTSGPGIGDAILLAIKLFFG